MKDCLKNIRIALGEVFARSSYRALSGALALAVFLFAVWLPNIGLLADIFTSSNASLVRKLSVTVSLLGGIRTNFSMFSAGYTVALAVLFGINVALVVYSLKRSGIRLARRGTGAAFGGAASGALGIGCAACASFLVNATLSFVGAVGALSILPLRGGEFEILAVVLLLVSLTRISKQIASLTTCNVTLP